MLVVACCTTLIVTGAFRMWASQHSQASKFHLLLLDIAAHVSIVWSVWTAPSETPQGANALRCLLCAHSSHRAELKDPAPSLSTCCLNMNLLFIYLSDTVDPCVIICLAAVSLSNALQRWISETGREWEEEKQKEKREREIERTALARILQNLHYAGSKEHKNESSYDSISFPVPAPIFNSVSMSPRGREIGVLRLRCQNYIHIMTTGHYFTGLSQASCR